MEILETGTALFSRLFLQKGMIKMREKAKKERELARTKNPMYVSVSVAGTN